MNDLNTTQYHNSNDQIRKMRKDQLLELIRQALDNINKINDFSQDLENKKNCIDSSYNEINGDNGILNQIKKLKEEAEEKIKSINDFYDEVFEGNDSDKPIKEQIDELLKYYYDSKERIKDFRIKIFGGKITNENGEVEEIKGLEKEINNFYSEQQIKYKKLYQQIEEELKGGATSVNLTKAFADKVKEYRTASWIWSMALVILLGLMSLYFKDFTNDLRNVVSLDDAFRNLVVKAPFLGFVIWLGVFLANRRAEAKKLEESYKHKEVMARSFVGYKRALEQIGEEDHELLKKHMDNLLEAIKENSSNFLDEKGEDYPLSSWLGFKKDKKVNKGDIKESK